MLYGGGDPEWLHELPREHRVTVMAYMLARKESDLALWSTSGLQASDLVHLLSTVSTGRKSTTAGGDLMDGLLGQLLAEPDLSG